MVIPAGGARLVRGWVAPVHRRCRPGGRKTGGSLMLLGRRCPPSMMLGPRPRLSRWSVAHVRRMRRWSRHALVRDARREVYRCACRGGGGVANASPLHRVEPIVCGHHAGGPGQGGPSSVVPVRHVGGREVGRAGRVAVQGVSKVELLWTFAPLALVSKPMPHPTDHVRQLPMASPAGPPRSAGSLRHHQHQQHQW